MVAWPFIIVAIKVPLILLIHAVKKNNAQRKLEEFKKEVAEKEKGGE